MPVRPKQSDAVTALRTEAQQLRDKLLDASKPMTVEEVRQSTEGLQALETRITAISGLSPEAELDDQGGDEALRRAAPDAASPMHPAGRYDMGLRYRRFWERLGEEVAEEFGGPNGYLRALMQASGDVARLPEKQRGVINRVQKFWEDKYQKRAIIGDAGDASGGEFLLPLQQVPNIFAVGVEQPSFLDYCTQYPIAGRTLRIPVLEQTNAADTRPTAGIANVSIVGEGTEKPERQPSFIQRLLTAYKIAAYSELGDETLEDDFTGQLQSTVQAAIGGQIRNFLGELITYDGTGTAMPLGAVHANNAALYSVDRLTTGAITTRDVFEMFARHVFGGGRSVWLAHSSVLPELMDLTLGGSGASLVTWLQQLQGAPQMMLLGVPVVLTDMAPVLGSPGDLALLNGGFYACAIRKALTVQSSIHYRFRNDLTALRFVMRGGGIPIPTGTYSYKSTGVAKVYEKSPFVALGANVAS